MSARTPWIVTGAALAALAAIFVAVHPARASIHPDPRPGITADKVLPPALVPHMAGAAEAYVAARTVPQVLDGLYCHCDCSKHLGHRSLLTCFESDHAAYCDICMGEATLAAQMTASGNTLAAIRTAVDADFSH